MGLFKNGNTVLFFGPYPSPITGQSLSFKEVYDNFSGDKILFDSTSFGHLKLLNTLFCFIKLPFLFLFVKFDTIYFTSTRSSLGFLKDFILLALANFFKKKVVNHLHGNDFKEFYEKSIFRKLITWGYKTIDVSIVLLPSMRQQYSNFKNMKVEVIRNSYSIEYQNEIINLDTKKNQIFYLSNLMCSKGVFIFLECVSLLLNKNSDLVIKIAGIPMADYLMSRSEVAMKFEVTKKQLLEEFPNNFFYLGVVKGKEKRKLLKDSSIFVLPTYHKTEAFPISIVEAMRFGNAVVTSKHNFLGEIITERNGRLIEPKSVVSLMLNLNTLLANKLLLRQIQEFNINDSITNYSPVTFNSKIYTILSKLS